MKKMSTKKMSMFRQGDVVLIEVNAIPSGGRIVPRDNGRIVLAYGEATGHAHAIWEPGVTMWEVDDGIRYLDAEMNAFLRHEEHARVPLKKGEKFLVLRQVYYTPEAIRPVID